MDVTSFRTFPHTKILIKTLQFYGKSTSNTQSTLKHVSTKHKVQGELLKQKRKGKQKGKEEVGTWSCNIAVIRRRGRREASQFNCLVYHPSRRSFKPAPCIKIIHLFVVNGVKQLVEHISRTQVHCDMLIFVRAKHIFCKIT